MQKHLVVIHRRARQSTSQGRRVGKKRDRGLYAPSALLQTQPRVIRCQSQVTEMFYEYVKISLEVDVFVCQSDKRINWANVLARKDKNWLRSTPRVLSFFSRNKWNGRRVGTLRRAWRVSVEKTARKLKSSVHILMVAARKRAPLPGIETGSQNLF